MKKAPLILVFGLLAGGCELWGAATSSVSIYEGETAGDIGEVRAFDVADNLPRWHDEDRMTIVTIEGEPSAAESVQVEIAVAELAALEVGTVLTGSGGPNDPTWLTARAHDADGVAYEMPAHSIEVTIALSPSGSFKRAIFRAEVMYLDEVQILEGSFDYDVPSSGDGDSDFEIDEWD
jgi:hypothetical protein